MRAITIRSLILSLTLLIPTVALAQSPGTGAAMTGLVEQPGGWQGFSHDEGRYSVRMPGQPVVATELLESGGELVIAAYELSDEVAFLVTYTDHASDAAASDAAAALERELVSDIDPDNLIREQVRRGGAKGWRVHAPRADGSAMDVLTLPVERRVYQLIVVHRGTAADPHVNMFFSSFRLQPEETPSASASRD